MARNTPPDQVFMGLMRMKASDLEGINLEELDALAMLLVRWGAAADGVLRRRRQANGTHGSHLEGTDRD
jgi:hypothetical protein